MAAGVQILGGAGQRHVERHEAAARHCDRRPVGRHMAPSAESTRSQARRSRSRSTSGAKCGLPRFLLALDQHLEVDRQAAGGLHERLGDQDRDQHRPLVVGDAARIEAAVADRRLERRRDPFLDRVGRLHVVVAVDQDGRRARGTRRSRRAPPDDRPSRRSRPAGGRRASAGPRQIPPPRECLAVCRVGADAGNAAERLQIVQRFGGMRGR